MSKFNNSIPVIVVTALLALAFGVYFQNSERADITLPTFEKVIILPKSKFIDGIDFIDHQGLSFTQERLLGYWSILFFGFTNCPDICPTTMQTLKQIKTKLVKNNAWGNYQVVMVSVDPLRDTPEQLANYVPYFDSQFTGITGSLDTTTEFAKQLGILFYAKEHNEDGRYDVDHGTALILINPKGEMAGVISAPHQAEVISRDLSKLADYFAQDHIAPETETTSSATPIYQHGNKLQNSTKETSSDLMIENGWIRPPHPGAENLAGYFNIVNTSAHDITITQADSPSFENTMIHQTVVLDGTASMRHLDGLLIRAKSRVSLRPLATHLMLMAPIRDLQIGELVTVNLSTDDGATYRFQLEVRQNPLQSNQQTQSNQ